MTSRGLSSCLAFLSVTIKTLSDQPNNDDTPSDTAPLPAVLPCNMLIHITGSLAVELKNNQSQGNITSYS